MEKTVDYQWKYVTSKYVIRTVEGQDWNQKILRYNEDISDQQASIRNNITRDMILEMLELRREVDRLEALLASQS